MPTIYLLAGCNGAGKSTISKTLLPSILDCKEFVNADDIARGISPFQPETVAFKAGRLMLERISELAEARIDFAIETTLSTRSYAELIEQYKKSGYRFVLVFLYVNDVQTAIRRVKDRVIQGGHGIPEDIIIRRYHRGLENFIKLYIPLADLWFVFDNSGTQPIMVSHGNNKIAQKIYFPDIWEQISK